MTIYNKVLWIEDFAEGDQTMDKFDFDQTYVHDVNDFASSLLYINQHYGSFDTVLLDVNLELGDIDDGQVQQIMAEFIHEKHLKKLQRNRGQLKDNAGFYAFLYLLHKGFPVDRICFLTGYKYVDVNTKFKQLRETMEKHRLHTSNQPIDSGELYEHLEAFMSEADFADIATDFMMFIEEGATTEAYRLLVETEKQVKELDESEDHPKDIYGKWDKDFAATGIKQPIGFSKEIHEEFRNFTGWFKNTQEEKPYYFLRYGLVSACDFLLNKLEESERFLRFEDDFYLPKKHKEVLDDSHQERKHLYSKDYFQGLLIALKEMLPLHEPSEQVKKSLYKQIIRFVSHDWEAVVSVNKYSRVFSNQEQGYKDQTYFYIMKLLRNWSAHNKLLEFKEGDVAFFLLIAFRSYFRLNDNRESLPMQDYEYVLLQLVKELDSPAWEKEYNQLQGKFQRHEIKLNEQFDQLRKRIEGYYGKQGKEYYSMSVNLYDVLKDIGNDLPECSGEDLIIMLWYGMCQVTFGNYAANVINVTYHYNQINKLIRLKKNDLFTHLYVRTFAQLGKPVDNGC